MNQLKVIVNSNIPMLTIKNKSLAIEDFKKTLYKVLEREFLGKDICLITIDPHENSLGIEVKEHKMLKVRKRDFLVSKISNVSIEFLKTLFLIDYEFWTGLTWVCESETYDTDLAKTSIEAFYFNYSSYPIEFIRCYDTTLVEWYNPHTNIENIAQQLNGSNVSDW